MLVCLQYIVLIFMLKKSTEGKNDFCSYVPMVEYIILNVNINAVRELLCKARTLNMNAS